MPNSLPSVPYKTPMLDQQGFASPVWSAWFRDVFQRIGGNRASTNSELEGDTSTTAVAITALQAQVISLQNQINSIDGGLTQGRVL